MKITIETIPHAEQRYDTAGDWTVREDKAGGISGIHIRVSKMSTPAREMAVAVHELVEALGCVFGGVSQAEVDSFDMAFDLSSAHPPSREPGDDPRAPYYEHHQFASGVERLCAHEWDIDWNSYNDEIERLGE